MARRRKPKSVTVDLSGFAREIGATPGHLFSYDYTVQTKIGPLAFKAFPGEATGGFWIACRFDDVDAAKAHFGVRSLGHRLNPFSGKWNFSEGLGHDAPETVEYVLALFKNEVRKLLVRSEG